MKRYLSILLICVAFASFAEGNKEYPARSIEWVFPFKAGIPVHTHAQLTALYLSEELGVEVNITAMPGGGGTKAANYVLNQEADGYTIFDAWVAPLVFTGLQKDVGYTYKDFTPIGQTNLNSFILTVRKDHPVNNLEDFIEYASNNPGLKFNSGGDLNVPHAVLSYFLKQQGIKAKNVPYPGIAAGFPDFLSGILDFSLSPIVSVANTYKDNMQPLCIFADERHHWVPDIPTAEELGYGTGFGTVAAGWNYLVFKNGVPETAVKALRDALKRVFENEEYIQKCNERFLTFNYESPEDYEKICTDGIEKLQAGLDAIEWEKSQF